MMTPINALLSNARNCPNKTAFIVGEAVWSYGRFAAEVDRMARALVARGVKTGDCVVFHMVNRPEVAAGYYACFRIGAIAVPLNIRFKTAELRPLLSRLRPTLYLGEAKLYPEIEPIEVEILPSQARYVLDGAGQGGAQAWESLFPGADETALPDIPADDVPAMLLTTSGTTGVPKLVALTPATLSAMSDAFKLIGFADKRHVVIHSSPMAHGSGAKLLFAAIRHGIPMVLLERFDPDAVLDAIERHRGTWFMGLPFMYSEIVRRQQMRPRRVSSLRLCLSGGDVCPLELQEVFPHLFGIPLRSGWAMTEVTGMLTYGLRPGPVSRIVPGSQVRVVDENGNQVPRGEVGELLVRGPNVAVGYWRGPGQIDDLTEHGWFHTGDLMKWVGGDELWFVGRKKDLIIRGGSNISPVEVEQVLRSHPAVREVAVAGVADPVLGQRVAALVELTGGYGKGVVEDILRCARAQLADYKMPERLTVVDTIPRNALGKVDRRALPVVVLGGAVAKPVGELVLAR
jgi:acyl-CoA synthetase (AMP-forming)/AMP-acid ligase II